LGGQFAPEWGGQFSPVKVVNLDRKGWSLFSGFGWSV